MTEQSGRKGTRNRGFRCPDEVWEPAKAKAATDPVLEGGGVSAVLTKALRDYVRAPGSDHGQRLTVAGEARMIDAMMVVNGPTGRHRHEFVGVAVTHEHPGGADPHGFHVLTEETP